MSKLRVNAQDGEVKIDFGGDWALVTPDEADWIASVLPAEAKKARESSPTSKPSLKPKAGSGMSRLDFDLPPRR